MNLPSTIRRPLEGQHFQVAVIGGGVNGVAIARECARAGWRTLLVEQHDFAAGTTSRSTRMIHGGLRYLEHGEIGLVRESLRERQRLLRERPHLVHPINLLLALDSRSRRSAFSIRAGLWLYRRLGGKPLGAGSSQEDARKFERSLDSGRRWSIFNFEDAQCEFPERLVAEWLMEAVQAGAVARNHTQALAVDVFHGRAKGILLRDRLSGKEDRVEANWIVNATGPWVDRVCQRSRISTGKPMVGGVRGSHLVLPRFAGAPDAAVYSEATDRRPFFVIPWNEQILVGTTEIPDSGDPAKAEPSTPEMEYLLRSLLHLFPRARVSLRDVRYGFAGVRPLPLAPGTQPADISRRHFLHDHSTEGAAHMISVVGGKLSTAAELARQCAAKLGLRPRTTAVPAPFPTETLDALLDGWVSEIADAGGINAGSAQALVEWHGPRSRTIAATAASNDKMRAALCPHTQHIVAEAVDAFIHQGAASLADVLLRRVPVALGGCWSQDCSRDATLRIATAMGWNEQQAASELEAFETERSAFLHKPARVDLMLEAAAD
jgi:glycerol-3-phosphate dehydrogenase